jgi:hypothetical protein
MFLITMFTTKKKQHLIDNTCGWMLGIENRVGSGIAWGLTTHHRQFIELVQSDEGNITLEEWSKAAKTLMQFHAMARNDIYDGFTYEVNLDAEGHEQAEFEAVSREEKDVRVLLYVYHTEYGDEEE